MKHANKQATVQTGTLLLAAFGLFLAILIHLGCQGDPLLSQRSAYGPDADAIADIVNEIPPAEDGASIAPPADSGTSVSDTAKTKPNRPPEDFSGQQCGSLQHCTNGAASMSKTSGGSISLGCGDNVETFVVFPNSLSEDVTITYETFNYAASGLQIREYHFGPDGLLFDPAACLKISGSVFKREDGSYESEIVWLYYNRHRSRWDIQLIIPLAEDGNYYIPVSHFSAYRAATRSSVGLSQGGQLHENRQ